ncbi:unnamed protein product [Clonostachys chloroleuca]|uniref:Tumor susceptibility gene 101 protein n=1 Tax=Clonostachys chloroleuca TaxID=1926264 RepID=A0AA35VS19_9HYPO|nr:unnamed protein product [Clonostachys chloroleuca]
MPVPQHVLNWLYSVLTSEYHDVNRTYNDVAHALSRYSTLSPRTDVHTFPNGASALLLHLSGTLPVDFRGNTYRFPVSIWVPHAYPKEPPTVYVTPTDKMMVRPGQHVDPQGQVYHPYLVRWAEFWDKSTLHDFLAILSDIFAKEPPVVSRQQVSPTHAQLSLVQSPPPVPPLPPEMGPRPSNVQQYHIQQQEQHDRPPPPPPPPKTSQGAPIAYSSPSSSHESGPPLPPIPQSSSPVSRKPSRYDSAPPLPPQIQSPPVGTMNVNAEYQHAVQSRQQSMSLPPGPGIGPNQGLPMPMNPPHLQLGTQQPIPQEYVQGQWGLPPASTQQQVPQPPWQGYRQPPQAQPNPEQPPPPDLIDEPVTLNVSAQSSVAPPPIPPNPEKDALLVQAAHTLASMRQQSRQKDESTMAGLQAQRNAMLAVLPTLQSEMGQLAQLSNLLTSNSSILHDALHKADGVIEGSRRHPAPDIDELLVAPTVVSNQLYTLVAEERALGDAIFMLGRAVERGRISPAVFAKMTRSLAREWYLKKALVRKIGVGMGLTL